MSKNLLYIFTDQHNPTISGAYGNPYCKTPNIDALAEGGTRFDSAFTNCPLCCPARASLATGRYAHTMANWNNSFAYDGSETSWHHRLRASGISFDAIGKLHFRSSDDDNGFSHEFNTMHLVNGIGDLAGNLRHDTTIFNKRKSVLNAGIGESMYTKYDAENADTACQWLSGRKGNEDPWALFLGIALPHPPNIIPQEYFDLYKDIDLPLPVQWDKADWPTHAALEYARKFFKFTEPISEEMVQNFQKVYYGAVSYVDMLIGKVLKTLEASGMADDTLIVYSSDHGEDLGARGFFGKFHMYDEAVKIPLILKGPKIPQGKVVSTPVSLVDMYKTILQYFEIELTVDEKDFPGGSLFPIVEEDEVLDRQVFAEYHGSGSLNAVYMIRDRKYKYIHYVGFDPLLFDVQNDPQELVDLSKDKDFEKILSFYDGELRKILDPEAVNAEAKHDQLNKVALAGGEEAVRKIGTFDNSPPPGVKVEFMGMLR